MQRSSHNVGALAAALAKAQAEIQNPEKSLTATIVALSTRGDAELSLCPAVVGARLGAQMLGRGTRPTGIRKDDLDIDAQHTFRLRQNAKRNDAT
jgi:hypothetical protein